MLTMGEARDMSRIYIALQGKDRNKETKKLTEN